MAQALVDSSDEVAGAWAEVQRSSCSDLPVMGLGAGDRPSADVEVLAGVVAAAEYDLARRMHAASSSGCLPLHGQGMMLAARAWSVPWARRLARAGALVCDHPGLGSVWSQGVITSEHVDAIARHVDRLTKEELAAVIEGLEPHWGRWSPPAITRFLREAIRMLHPRSDDPEPDEASAYASRGLSFALTADSVILSGELPRLEGELVIAALDSFAERLRSTADHVPASARRADALVELVNAAHASGAMPSRGGLPVSLSVTLDHTSLGHPTWNTSRGHRLTESEARFTGCDAAITPVLIEDRGRSGSSCPDTVEELLAASEAATGYRAESGDVGCEARWKDSRSGLSERIAALAATMLGQRVPIAVGRTERMATPGQRRALAARDKGCIIPGCGVPAEACQVHHVTEWSAGGPSDPDNLALLCWSHHRQVDLRMWTIGPADPSHPLPHPHPDPGPSSPRGAAWPANNGAPWIIRAAPRTRWRM